VGILICPHMRVVCITDIVAIELRFISKQDVTMQLATAIEPHAKFQPLSKIARSEMLHLLHVDRCPLHAVFSTLSCGEHEDVLQFFAYSHVDCSVPSEQCLRLHRRLINIMLGCNANAGKCTGISQCLVNSSKHSLGWSSTVQKTLLIFSCSMN